MVTKTFLTNEFTEHGVKLTIVRRETHDGYFELESGEITTPNEDRMELTANDIKQLTKLFSAAEDKGLCI